MRIDGAACHESRRSERWKASDRAASNRLSFSANLLHRFGAMANGSQLADLLEEERERICIRFVGYAKATGTSDALAGEQVIDSLREFLTELADALRADPNVPQSQRSAYAGTHGQQRFSLGFDIATVVREYASLYELLLDVIHESGRPIAPEEVRAMTRRIFGAAGEAAEKYAAARDEDVRRRTSQHLAFLAHELRNPLSSARMAYALMRERGDVKATRAGDVLERGLTRVMTLINDSLVTIRLNALGRLESASVDIGQLLAEVGEESVEDAEAKGVELHVSGGGRVNGDRKALWSAVSNLVRNAVKFTAAGGHVHVTSKCADERVIIEVADECGGLPDGRAQTLFDPFVQAGLDRSGFGLGLAIAKQATDAHGGSLRVHDVPGRGCVFVLDLPAESNVEVKT
jgi:signal transduction histidine kinase